MQPRHIIRTALIASVLVVAACQEMDPYTRPMTWQPTGSNAGNIAAQAANPYDLIRGRGVDKVDSKASDIAVERVWTDKPKTMIRSGSTSGSGGGGGGGGSSGSGS